MDLWRVVGLASRILHKRQALLHPTHYQPSSKLFILSPPHRLYNIHEMTDYPTSTINGSLRSLKAVAFRLADKVDETTDQ